MKWGWMTIGGLGGFILGVMLAFRILSVPWWVSFLTGGLIGDIYFTNPIGMLVFIGAMTGLGVFIGALIMLIKREKGG